MLIIYNFNISSLTKITNRKQKNHNKTYTLYKGKALYFSTLNDFSLLLEHRAFFLFLTASTNYRAILVRIYNYYHSYVTDEETKTYKN